MGEGTSGTRTWLFGAVLEAGLIVFAVLVALGVDEYREGREERRLAEVAEERIATEIAANRADLLDSRADNERLLGELERAIVSLESGNGPGIEGVNYEVSLLGADAWNTAQVTRAVHFMDFDRVGRISMVYRVQELYLDRQSAVVDLVAELVSGELLDTFAGLVRGLTVALDLECGLLEEHDKLLDELLPGESRSALPASCEGAG